MLSFYCSFDFSEFQSIGLIPLSLHLRLPPSPVSSFSFPFPRHYPPRLSSVQLRPSFLFSFHQISLDDLQFQAEAQCKKNGLLLFSTSFEHWASWFHTKVNMESDADVFAAVLTVVVLTFFSLNQPFHDVKTYRLIHWIVILLCHIIYNFFQSQWFAFWAIGNNCNCAKCFCIAYAPIKPRFFFFISGLHKACLGIYVRIKQTSHNSWPNFIINW